MDKELSLDTAVLPKELHLILSFIKSESEGSLCSFDADDFTGINWHLFLELIRHHRVNPYIYKQIKQIEKTYIPDHVCEELRREYQQNTFLMLRLSAEMEQLCRLFADHKIEMLSLKGPALAVDLYGDISKRTCSDLDLLISIDNLDRAHDLLVALGYVKDDYFSTVMNDWKWRHHHVTYTHSQKRTKIEIHWKLNPGLSYEPSFNELWERRKKSSIASFPVYMLGYEDLFMFLVSHGARHGWSRLRWLVDIDRIARHQINWEKQIVCLKKYKIAHVGGQALVLAINLLATPLTKEMKTLIEGKRPVHLAHAALFYLKQMIHLHREPLPGDVARYHKRHLFSLMSNQLKVLHILSFLYPYPMDVELIPLPKNLHFLYFPLRPFMWLWRKTRRHSWS
ncbi:Renal dipeptidase [Paenibacillus sp. LMG 31458]|uniref:Renal dipeptidase n=1 Tax=Paenibacillus phytorum TaxID=2654977 RepID=A0ABX1XQR0_9BACL|nr:nucleotidyltransferase family protein [Paenibacillus phytorum]NOU70888.1 Renal dipeptidase [Paenibacillus phytorum]